MVFLQHVLLTWTRDYWITNLFCLLVPCSCICSSHYTWILVKFPVRSIVCLFNFKLPGSWLSVLAFLGRATTCFVFVYQFMPSIFLFLFLGLRHGRRTCPPFSVPWVFCVIFFMYRGCVVSLLFSELDPWLNRVFRTDILRWHSLFLLGLVACLYLSLSWSYFYASCYTILFTVMGNALNNFF